MLGVPAPSSTNFVIEYRPTISSKPALPSLPPMASMAPMASLGNGQDENRTAKRGALIALSLVAIAAFVPVIWNYATQPSRPRRRRRR
jgi:hypothetical protein